VQKKVFSSTSHFNKTTKKKHMGCGCKSARKNNKKCKLKLIAEWREGSSASFFSFKLTSLFDLFSHPCTEAAL
jgi:hypothetical protein